MSEQRDRRSQAAKTIQRQQVRYVPLADLRPGDITPEGLVVAVRATKFETCAGEYEPGDSGKIVVFACVTEAMTAETIEALREQKGTRVLTPAQREQAIAEFADSLS